jgi:anti-sigma B factor antagonist
MNLNINVNRSEEHIQIDLAGEIDAYTAPKLREELMPLAEEGKPVLIVSLKDVSYMDSTGLGAFVGLLKAVRKNEGDLKLVHLSARLERLFNITGLSDIIDISSKSEGGVR